MKLLVVDDDVVSRMALLDVINTFGPYRTVEAQNADEAWDRINGKGAPPMLVCCDIRMPGMSGIELLQKVRQHPPTRELPFVLISMANDAETIKEAIKIGISGYIVKPFSLKDARDRLEKVLTLAGSKAMETPAVTMARLKLPVFRYRAYLTGLESRLGQLTGEVAKTSESTPTTAMVDGMQALCTACTTLGMWRGATLLKQCVDGNVLGIDVDDCLADVRLQLQHQLAAVA
jgi:two-component system chemotaxis response regulator CheY